MQTMQLQAGATIFHTGDPSLAVYVIANGEVAISVNDGATDREVVRLHAGELFGESGVLEGRCRAATATAVTDTTLLVTEADMFFHAFGMTDDRALVLVKLLCRRLRDTSLRAVEGKSADAGDADPPHAHPPHQPPAVAPAQAENAVIRLLPDRGRLVTEFHMTPIDVKYLPFRVSNCLAPEASPVVSNQSCLIAAHDEADLSAPHFEILRRDGELGVRDLRSRFGTIVNGLTIAKDSTDTFASLYPGANDVIAGRHNSPFRFRVQIREA